MLNNSGISILMAFFFYRLSLGTLRKNVVCTIYHAEFIEACY
jgi:hypothetical protein